MRIDELDARRDATVANLALLERSRAYLWNMLTDEPVAPLAADMLCQAPRLLAVLLTCRGVFPDAASLYEALLAAPWAAPAWRGRRANLRPVYARLRAALEETVYPLCDEGFYGFFRRASAEQIREMDARREQRIARARASRARRRAAPA